MIFSTCKNLKSSVFYGENFRQKTKDNFFILSGSKKPKGEINQLGGDQNVAVEWAYIAPFFTGESPLKSCQSQRFNGTTPVKNGTI